MKLLELTPDEVGFLTAPHAAPDGLQVRLCRKLATTLTARLRLPVEVMTVALETVGPLEAPAIPQWHPDAALSNLWLTRRLGGRHVTGTAAFVPPTLIHALDATLAECWLDAPTAAELPRAQAWQMTTTLAQATLTVWLPQNTTEMTRWARGVIRHG